MMTEVERDECGTWMVAVGWGLVTVALAGLVLVLGLNALGFKG